MVCPLRVGQVPHLEPIDVPSKRTGNYNPFEWFGVTSKGD